MRKRQKVTAGEFCSGVQSDDSLAMFIGTSPRPNECPCQAVERDHTACVEGVTEPNHCLPADGVDGVKLGV